MHAVNQEQSEAGQKELKQEEAIYQSFQQADAMRKLGWLETGAGEKLWEDVGEGIGHVDTPDRTRSAFAEENVISFIAGANWAIRGGRLG